MNYLEYPVRILTPEESRLQKQGQKKLKIYQEFVATHKNLSEAQEMKVFHLRFNRMVSPEAFVEALKKI